MPLDLGRIRGLCFDVDGTISDTDDAWVDRIARWLAPLHALIKPRQARRFARWLVMFTESPMNAVYYSMDALSLDDNFARLFDRLVRRKGMRGSRFNLMNGARELLDTARSRYPLTVVSARDTLTTSHFLHQFSLQDHFVEVVTSQSCAHTKPFADPVLFAAERMQVPPEACLMIGDTTVDILAGKRAGAQTVGLLCGFGTENELRRAGADLVLNDLHELYALLFSS